MMFFKKKWYWYEVKFVYRDSYNGNILFDFKSQIGLKYQNTCLNKREIKKTIPSLYEKVYDFKYLLCNGNLDCEIICFLGRFGKK